MSNKELPAPAGAEQSSVFSVFGYRSNVGGGDALTTPLEDAPGLGDRRHVRRKHSRTKEEETLSQMSQTPARKLDNILPENSKVISTQIGVEDPAKVSQQPKGPLHTFARRYSRPQASSGDETFDANALINKFNSSLTFSTYSQNLASGDANDTSEPDPHVLQRYFGRRRSSPDVGSLADLKTTKLQLAEKIASQALLEVPGDQMASKKTMDKSASFSNLETAVATGKNPVATTQAMRTPTVQDSVDAQTSAFSESSSGFGILSRTRKFGAWLTRATEGEKMEVTKKDLNAFAPTSF